MQPSLLCTGPRTARPPPKTWFLSQGNAIDILRDRLNWLLQGEGALPELVPGEGALGESDSPLHSLLVYDCLRLGVNVCWACAPGQSSQPLQGLPRQVASDQDTQSSAPTCIFHYHHCLPKLLWS